MPFKPHAVQASSPAQRPDPAPSLPEAIQDANPDAIVLSSERSAPVRPSEIHIAGSSNGSPITAQMMLRYFHPSIPGEELNFNKSGGATNSLSGSPRRKPAGGTETAVWLPIQFVPPEPFSAARPRSSSSYEVTSPSTQPAAPSQR
ncbi:MAG: hypothetical protein HYR88_17885 [Verrucomicrobia bacterium]|nr:hypothetical protein [Verrucomicrobiota bacterium]MBI3868798.1 hypothetical protein [Verrucomicrobiota bacterium]